MTSELLRFASSRISDKESTVELDQLLLDLLLGSLVNILLVVSNDSLSDSLTDGVDLRSRATTTDTDADVHLVEHVVSEDVERFHNLSAENLGAEKIQRDTVNLHQTSASLAGGDSGGGFLLAEDLDGARSG